jgi:hypothetical protein
VQAIVLYPFVFFSAPRELVSEAVICHEMIHVRQVRRHGWVPFYVKYLWEYFSLRAKGAGKREAYHGISFEREAYHLASREELSESERREAELA